MFDRHLLTFSSETLSSVADFKVYNIYILYGMFDIRSTYAQNAN